MKTILSIIIPAYNAANYIDDCMRSLFADSINNCLYEVIIVNDGSTDDTLPLIQKWKSLYSNVLVLNKEINSGVSAARNDAIEIAQGDYLTFLDVDDWFDTKGLDRMIKELINHPEVDGLILNLENADTGEYNYAWQSLFNAGENYSFEQFYHKSWFGRGSACAIAYKRSFLSGLGLRFAQNVTIGEDTLFTNQFLTSNGCFRFLDSKLYYIRQTVNSASRNYSEKKLNGSMLAVDYCFCFINENDLSPKQQYVYNWLLYQLLSNAINTACSLGLSFRRVNKDYDIKRYLPIPIEGIKKQKKKIRILNMSPRLFFWLVKIKHVLLIKKP